MLVICNLPQVYEKYKARWIQQQAINGFVDMSHSETAKLEPFKTARLESFKTPKLWNQRNSCGLTPLTLAARLGRSKMLAWLLDERKILQWSYGDVSCVLHPLDQLDLGFHKEVNFMGNLNLFILISLG